MADLDNLMLGNIIYSTSREMMLTRSDSNICCGGIGEELVVLTIAITKLVALSCRLHNRINTNNNKRSMSHHHPHHSDGSHTIR